MIRALMFKKRVTHLLSAAIVSAVAAGSLGMPTASYAQESDGPRQPPATRTSQTLSEPVFRQISEISELMNPAEEGEEPDYARAKQLLDRLNERYDRMNDFEKATLLNFYTNYYFGTDNIPETMRTFERMLTIEDLRPEQRLRALMTLGQLYSGDERYQDSINMLNQWRELSEEESATVFLVLVNNYYNLEQFSTAVPLMLEYMDMMEANGEAIPRDRYALLNQMYLELEDYPASLNTIRTMVTLFNDPSDWRNLAAIYGMLERDQQRIHTLGLTYSGELMSNEAEYVNLASSLAGADAPYKGAKVLEAGMQAGIVEENADNLERLTQMYLMASEYEMALVPARKAAEMGETGDAYDHLGYIYYMMRDYEGAAEAIRMAIQRGGLKDTGETQAFLARALVEIEDFDGAAAAATAAQRAGYDAANLQTHIERTRAWRENLDLRKAEAIDFYQS